MKWWLELNRRQASSAPAQAMFSRRATAVPTLVAGVVGSLTSYYVAYHTSIGFMWPSTFGLSATLLVGLVLTLLSPDSASEDAQKLTWWVVATEAP